VKGNLEQPPLVRCPVGLAYGLAAVAEVVTQHAVRLAVGVGGGEIALEADGE
jgi:hypothetical protein